MEEKKCEICNKSISPKENYWTWGDEPAHKKCVLELCSYWCEECSWFSEDDDICDMCGEDMKPLTEKKKKELLKKDF